MRKYKMVADLEGIQYDTSGTKNAKEVIGLGNAVLAGTVGVFRFQFSNQNL